MNFESITVHEYEGNDFDRSRKAKLYENGKLEYLPEPDYPDEEEEELIDEEEDEDSV